MLVECHQDLIGERTAGAAGSAVQRRALVVGGNRSAGRAERELLRRRDVGADRMAEALGRIVALTGRRIDRRISDRVLRGAHGLEVSGGDVEDLAQVAAGLERRRLTRRNQLQVAVRRVAVDLQRDPGRAVDALRRQLLPGGQVEQVAVPGLVEVGRPDDERVARGGIERQVQRHLAGGAEVRHARRLVIRIVHLDRHGSDGGVRKFLG